MTLTLPALIVLVVIAAICGAIGKALAGGSQGGLVASIALGFIGALFGPWVAHQLNLAEPLVLHVGGQPFPIVWSIIGAALFVALLHLMAGRRWSGSDASKGSRSVDVRRQPVWSIIHRFSCG